MELEKLQERLDALYDEMRNTNVRSYGLKVKTHERWCAELENCRKILAAAREPVPPPLPPG